MQKQNFVIISTELNGTAYQLHQEAQNLGYQSDFYQYQDLITNGDLLSKLNISRQTIGFIEIPFSPNQIEEIFQSVYRIITQEYQFGLLVNNQIYHKRCFCCIEDKFYQDYFFKKNNLPRAELFNPNKLEYPIIAKKRLSSRNRNNFILNSEENLKTFKKNNNLYQFIFQKYRPLKKDFRVLVAVDEILAVVEREITYKNENSIGVFVKEEGQLPSHVLETCKRTAKLLEADYLGVDIGQTMDDDFFIMEYNTRAQMVSTDKKLKTNLHQELLKRFIYLHDRQ